MIVFYVNETVFQCCKFIIFLKICKKELLNYKFFFKNIS